MRRYGIAISLVLLFFLTIFLLVERINPAFLANPYDQMGISGISAALIGVGLLLADIILPVPSSLIMISNGAIFGVAIGTILSITGNLGAALIGFYIGRCGEPVLARFVPPVERSRANQLLKEWGVFAVIITRPIPLLAETTVIMAGASTMQWRSMILATIAGSVPVAGLYAFTGATAVNFDNAVWSFVLVLLIAGLFWAAGHRLRGAIINKQKMPS